MPTNVPGEEEEPIILSALNDFLYCPRRCALHRLEGVFEHTAATVEGTRQHERAHQPGEDNLPGVRIVRALPLFSDRLGLVGKADVVEFHAGQAGAEVPLPVEYKHGPRRQWDNDDVQLCAQALCLEEMLATAVPAGAVFHVASRHRRQVPFDAPLREKTMETVAGVRRMLRAGVVPPAEPRPQCEGCSLHVLCLPALEGRRPALSHSVERLFRVEPESAAGRLPGDMAHGDQP